MYEVLELPKEQKVENVRLDFKGTFEQKINFIRICHKLELCSCKLVFLKNDIFLIGTLGERREFLSLCMNVGLIHWHYPTTKPKDIAGEDDSYDYYIAIELLKVLSDDEYEERLTRNVRLIRELYEVGVELSKWVEEQYLLEDQLKKYFDIFIENFLSKYSLHTLSIQHFFGFYKENRDTLDNEEFNKIIKKISSNYQERLNLKYHKNEYDILSCKN